MKYSKAKIIIGDSYNPYNNLALETHLLNKLDEQTIIMYLWQNADTVVIGKNQNCYVECNMERMKSENVKLARRISGGGAVFHDIGNLNFTFLCSKGNYDAGYFQKIILGAVRRFGIEAELSGRNDILAGGKKFSGNAVYHAKNSSFFHGTLLIDSTLERLPLYLNPSKKKLAAKNIPSVASRVTNLRSFNAELDADKMKLALCEEFALQTGLNTQNLLLSTDDYEQIEKYRLKYASSLWLFSDAFNVDYTFCERFDWGEIRIEMKLCNALITKCNVYSDCMDAFLPPKIQNALQGAKFEAFDVKNRLIKFIDGNMAENIVENIVDTIFGG